MSNSDDFDPYRKWLGIPKNRRPPNHYDILGIDLDEDDSDVIRSAAEQRRQFVQKQRGRGRDDSVTGILYQIDEAEITLLNPAQRREYDQKLKLFAKRRKRRQVETAPGRSRIQSRPGKTVGEGSGIVGLFAGIMAVIGVGFGVMYWFANSVNENANPLEKRPIAKNVAGPAVGSTHNANESSAGGSSDTVSVTPPQSPVNPTGEAKPVASSSELLPAPMLYLPCDSVPPGVVFTTKGGQYAAGKMGTGVQFDGTSNSELEAALPQGNAPRTLAFWVRNSNGQADHIVQVVTQTEHWERGKAFGIIQGKGYWRFQDMNGGLNSEIQIDNEWHHLAVTHDGNTIRMFHDGKLVAEAERRLETESNTLRIGGLGSPDSNFVGSIDELYVFDVPLSEDQIRQLMSGSTSPQIDSAPSIVEVQTQIWEESSTNFVRVEGNHFDLGLGDDKEGQGIAAVGWLVDGVKAATLDSVFAGTPQQLNEHTFVGVMIDYEVGENFVSRIALTPMANWSERQRRVPRWGKHTPPDRTERVHSEKYIGDSSRGFFTISLEDRAPSGWTGRAWVSLLLQATGINTGLKGEINFSGVADDEYKEPSSALPDQWRVVIAPKHPQLPTVDLWDVSDETGIIEANADAASELQSVESYQDFEMTFEWRFKPGGKVLPNGSGVVVRCDGWNGFGLDPKGIEIDLRPTPSDDGFLGIGCFIAYDTPVDVPDNRRQKRHVKALISQDAPPKTTWAKCKITCRNERLEFFTDGKLVNVADGVPERSGPIILRGQKSAVQFRNIEVHELDPRTGRRVTDGNGVSDSAIVETTNGMHVSLSLNALGNGTVAIGPQINGNSLPVEFARRNVPGMEKSEFFSLGENKLVAIHDFADTDPVEKIFSFLQLHAKFDNQKSTIRLTPQPNPDFDVAKVSQLIYGHKIGLPIDIQCDIADHECDGFAIKLYDASGKWGMIQFKVFGKQLERQVSWVLKRPGKEPVFENLLEDKQAFEIKSGVQHDFKLPTFVSPPSEPLLVELAAFQVKRDAPSRSTTIRRFKVQGDLRPGFGIAFDSDKNGVFVKRVIAGSSAASAGLKDGDRIVRIAGRRPESVIQAVEQLAEYEIGEAVPFEVDREGEKIAIEVVGG